MGRDRDRDREVERWRNFFSLCCWVSMVLHDMM